MLCLSWDRESVRFFTLLGERDIVRNEVQQLSRGTAGRNQRETQRSYNHWQQEAVATFSADVHPNTEDDCPIGQACYRAVASAYGDEEHTMRDGFLTLAMSIPMSIFHCNERRLTSNPQTVQQNFFTTWLIRAKAVRIGTT